MEFSIVVAMSNNRVIGRNGALPWKLSADLQHFKSITMGKPIVMGRLTHESIGRPLPGRENIILTRNTDYMSAGCTVIHSIDVLRSKYSACEEIMIVGGARLYAEALPLANRLFITEVHADIEGDVLFPEFDRQQWCEMDRQFFRADEKNEFDFSFVRLERL